MIDHIELAAMKLKTGRDVIRELEMTLSWSHPRKPARLYLWPAQHEKICRGIRGAIRRSPKPGCVTQKKWNAEIKAITDAMPITLHGIEIERTLHKEPSTLQREMLF